MKTVDALSSNLVTFLKRNTRVLDLPFPNYFRSKTSYFAGVLRTSTSIKVLAKTTILVYQSDTLSDLAFSQ